MTRAIVLLMVMAVVLVAAGAAFADLIQDDFEGYPVGAGVPAGWLDASKQPTATWDITGVGGNQVLRGVSGIAPPQADAIAGPFNTTGWFVENFEMQVSLRVESGEGGGVGMGQCDGNRYVGNSYYIGVAVPESCIVLYEEGLSGGGLLDTVSFAVGTLSYGQWYDLRMVSTGTAFEVWFRPKSAEAWQDSQKIIDVPHDILHPGHKSYVDGRAACWVSDDDGGPDGPSTMLFDDFRFEAAPFPAPDDFSDDFEDATFSLANWSSVACTLDFPLLDGSQVARVTADETRAGGGIAVNQGAQYYTHNFIMRTSLYLDSLFSGGVMWGWEGGYQDGVPTDTDFFIGIDRAPGAVLVELHEEQNSAGSSNHVVLGTYSEPEASGVFWYNLEVMADYNWYRVWWWQRGQPKPTDPVIAVRQDLAHPGYRLTNLGAAGLWQNPGDSGNFEDFYFYATAAPSVNTPEGPGVQVEPEPGLGMTFDNVSEGGTTTVETSTTAPGGGPGGLEFQGLYYDINTTCVYSGPITISLSYDDTGMTPDQEANLRLMHWVTANQTWVDITLLPVDTDNNIITGVTDSLSVFAIAALPVFRGFLQPINMPPAPMSVFKQKSTIPVRFRLINPATGAPVPNAAAKISVERLARFRRSCRNEWFFLIKPDSGDTFRYERRAGQYIFNLGTKSLTPGYVYRIHANIMGGLMDPWVDVAVK